MYKDNSLLIGLNKPRGVICSHKDDKGRLRIYDLLPKAIIKEFKSTIHSVGRLDFNSQGLILITNESKIKYYLERPASKIIRVYKAKIQGNLEKKHIERIKKGIYLNNIPYKVVNIVLQKKTSSYSWVNIVLNQGKNQHIRKIFNKLGFSVNKLIRIQYGPYKLATLSTGQTKRLNVSKIGLFNK